MKFRWWPWLLVLASCQPAALPPPPVDEPIPGLVSRTIGTTRTLLDVAVGHASTAGIDEAIAVGTDGEVWRFDGAEWTAESSGVISALEGIDGAPNNDGEQVYFAVGDGALLRRTPDGAWNDLSAGQIIPHLFGVHVRGADEAYAVGENGAVWQYLNGSTINISATYGFTQVPGEVNMVPTDIDIRLTDDLKSVTEVGGQLIMVGARGSVYEWVIQSTERFRVVDTRTNRQMADVFSGAGTWAAGTDGVLFQRLDDASWSDELRAPAPIFLQGIWGLTPSNLFTVGLADQVFEWRIDRWRVTALAPFTELRAIDGIEVPIAGEGEGEDEQEAEPVQQFIAVGSAGLVIRGPALLPASDETLLRSVAVEENE